MWYVIQVQARHELAVVEKCRKRVVCPGEDVFTILTERMSKRGGVWGKATEVAFQSYVFAETGDVDGFRIRLQNVREMAKMLGVGGQVTPIYPDEEQLLERLGGPEHIIRYSQGYNVDDRLVVTEGRMKGLEGKVKWTDRHQRMAGIELELLGQKIVVKLGVGILKRVPGMT